MIKECCLYCGSGNISPYEDENAGKQRGSLNCQIIQCRDCQTLFSEMEARFEADDITLNVRSKSDIQNEEATLDAALKKMQKQLWNHALELLFRHTHPLDHPLEFMIYRDICQAASCLCGCFILENEKDYDCVQTSDSLLGLLIGNLRNLDRYLPQNDEEKRFRILQRLFNALMLLGESAIDTTFYAIDSRNFNNSTLRKRSTALCVFADYLEDLQQTSHGLDYLKMSVQLWNKCMGYWGSGLFYYMPHDKWNRNKTSAEMHIPDEFKRQIDKKTAELNAAIRRRDPDYSEVTPAKRSFSANIPVVIAIVLCLCIVIFLVLEFNSNGKFKIMTAIQYLTHAAVGLIFIYMIYSICNTIRNDRKRVYLYKKLYK